MDSVPRLEAAFGENDQDNDVSDEYARDILSLLRMQIVDNRVQVLESTVRADATGCLIAVKDLIQAIEGSNSENAKKRLQKLKADGHITEGANSEFQKFSHTNVWILGAPIQALGRISAYLKGPIAKQVHALFIDSGSSVVSGDLAVVDQVVRNRDAMDRAAANGNVFAVACVNSRKTTVKPYVETIAHKNMSDRISRGIASGKVIPALCDEATQDAVKNITEVLTLAVRYANEMADVKIVFDTVKSDDRLSFLLDLKPIVSSMLTEHANQSVFGFACSTKQFKEENELPAAKQLHDYMSRRQLHLVGQYAESFLNQLEKDHNAGKEMTSAHVIYVSQKKRDHVFVTSQDLNLDQLVMDVNHNPLDIKTLENKNLATGCRLGKSARIWNEMLDDTEAQKKKKVKREIVLKVRFAKVSDSMVAA